MEIVLNVVLFLMCSAAFSLETRLLLIRHGETDWNLDGRMQGHTDTELNAKGILQAQEIAVKLLQSHPDIGVIYSSHLSRACQTAYETAKMFHKPIYQKQSLGEFDVGEARGKTEAEIVAQYGRNDVLVEKYPYNRERWNYSLVPGQEVINDRIQRIRQALVDISWAHPGGKVAVFTHRGCLRALIADMEDLDDAENIFVPNCAVLEVLYDSENREKPFQMIRMG